jgi:hypothetical protein
VLANQAAMTPFLRNVYKVLTDWNKTGKGKEKEVVAENLAPPPSKHRKLLPQLVPAHHLETEDSDTMLATDKPTDTPVVTIPTPMQLTTPVTEATRKGKGKGKGKEVISENLAPPESKHRKVSPQLMPPDDLETEDSDATPATDKKPFVHAKNAIMTASASLPLDLLWRSIEERPTPMCDTCTLKGMIACCTTGKQIACVTCRKVKTKCSYTASRTARRHELKVAGELKGKQKAGGKKTVKSEGSEAPRTATKRKCPAEATSGKQSGEEYIPVPSTSRTPRRILTLEPARSTDEPMPAGELKAKKKAVEKKRVKAAESEGPRTAPKRKHPAGATTGDQSGEECIPVGPALGPSTSCTSGHILTPEPARSTAVTKPQTPDTTPLPAAPPPGRITHPGCVPLSLVYNGSFKTFVSSYRTWPKIKSNCGRKTSSYTVH